jgi:ATP-binding cassette subfamily C protein
MLNALKKMWELQEPRLRLKFVLIIALMTVAAAMEMVGIGALLPIISVMQDPTQIGAIKILSNLSSALGNPSSQEFFVAMLLVLLAFFVFKNVYLVCLDLFQYKFWSHMQAKLSTALISSYLHRPYTFHLQVNTAQLIRNATTEVNSVFYYVFVPIGTLVTECLVVSALFLLIVFIDPIAALILTLAGGSLLYAFYWIFRDRMFQIGQHLQDSSGKMIQYAQEGLGGVKEIKVMGREEYFKNAFSVHVEKYSRALRRASVLHNFPGHVLETIFIAIFVGILITLAMMNKVNDAIPLIGVYAAAAFRLIPSLNRMMTAVNRLKQGGVSLQLVVAELSVPEGLPDSSPSLPLSFHEDIRLVDVDFRYPNAESDALSNISLRIARGEMVGFVGKSGSGKTTVVDCILGLLTPSAGKVLVDGVDIQGHLASWRSQIGYIPQHIYLTDDSLKNNIALGLADEVIDLKRIWSALEAAQLAEFVRELPDGLETAIGERGVRLSGGQRQRIGIARAMYYDPSVLILDEATSALDNDTERAIVGTLGALKHTKTIMVIAHRMTTIVDCDRVFVLEKGVLQADGIEA